MGASELESMYSVWTCTDRCVFILILHLATDHRKDTPDQIDFIGSQGLEQTAQ